MLSLAIALFAVGLAAEVVALFLIFEEARTAKTHLKA